MESILITGGCGFVGSNLALYFKQEYPNARVVSFDNLKRRGSELNLKRLKDAGIEFIHGDIRNPEDLDEVGAIECIVEAAAEPSVLAGINQTTDYVINTNLVGTINCLNFASKHNSCFIFLSTSRVYPFKLIDEIEYDEAATRFNISDNQSILGVSLNGISTDFPLKGARSLYGATKLASELIIGEYIEFLGLNAIINRCGVITGPWQMGKVDQGVVVLWMARHFWKKNLTYNGYGGAGKQVRDILHIHDLYRLVQYQFNNIADLKGQTFNVGGGIDCSISLFELTKFCEELTGNTITITPDPDNRIADLRIYISDNKFITEQTGWYPRYTPKEIMKEIFEWVQDNEKELYPILG